MPKKKTETKVVEKVKTVKVPTLLQAIERVVEVSKDSNMNNEMMLAIRPELGMLADSYGITERQLPELVPSGSLIGTLKPELCGGALTAKTRIVAGSFDHPTAARAAGVTRPGEMLLSCGTSWVG